LQFPDEDGNNSEMDYFGGGDDLPSDSPEPQPEPEMEIKEEEEEAPPKKRSRKSKHPPTDSAPQPIFPEENEG
jgi:hypothetical protein